MKIRKGCCCNYVKVIEMDAYFESDSLSVDVIRDARSMENYIELKGKWHALCPKCGKIHTGTFGYKLKNQETAPIFDVVAEISMDKQKVGLQENDEFIEIYPKEQE